jgi:hypothetical protein
LKISIIASRRWRLGLFLAAGFALAVPAAVIASHVFNDVPSDSPYHADTAAIAMAGVTNGCGGGNFCPTDPITRQQEAAFLHRGLGRVATGTDSQVDLPPETATDVSTLTITPGYTSGKLAGANGFLKIDGHVSLYVEGAELCDCFVEVRIYVDGVDAGTTQYTHLDMDSSYQMAAMGITAVVPISANGPRTVTLRVEEYAGGETLQAYPSLTALYVPFGSTGLDTLGLTPPVSGPVTRPGE